MTDTATTIEMAACGNEFMRIMQDYQERQNDDPNFDPRTEIYDLYDNMVHLYESKLFKLFNQ